MKISITLSHNGARFRVTSPYSPVLVDRFKTIPGREYEPATKGWTFPCVRDCLLMACDVCGILPSMLPAELQQVADYRPPPQEKPDLSLLNGHQFLVPPYEHQRLNLARLLAHPRWLLADEMGCIHPHVTLRCFKTGRTHTVEEWSCRGEVPHLHAYAPDGSIVTQPPSRLFIKKEDDCLQVVLINGSSVTVGQDHEFLVLREGVLCLLLAKDLTTTDQLATLPSAISGHESTTGTPSSSDQSNLRNKRTGSASSSEMALSTVRGPTTRSSWAWPCETLNIWSNFPATSSTRVVLPFTQTPAASSTSSCNCSATTSHGASSASAWTQRERRAELFPSCLGGYSITSGEASLMRMEVSKNTIRAQTTSTPHSPSPSATLQLACCPCGASPSKTLGLLSSMSSPGTRRIRLAAPAEVLSSCWATTSTRTPPASWHARRLYFEPHGLTAPHWDAYGHVIPTSCRNLSFLPISTILGAGRSPVYDMTMDGLGNYFDANGINHQNSGKSACIANRIKAFKDGGNRFPPAWRCLILCPKSCTRTWEEQLAVHAGLRCCIIEGTASQRRQLLRDAWAPPIKVANYELLLHTEEFSERIWTVVVADELHRAKNFTSATCKLVRRLSAEAQYVWGLSGTPAPNSLEDWLGVLSAIDPNLLPCKTKTAFEQRYLIKGSLSGDGTGPRVTQGYRNVPELHGYVSKITSRVTKAEALDLPPKVYSSRYVALAGEQARVYRDIRKDAVCRLADAQRQGTLTVQNVLTESLRLLQIAGGFVPDDLGQMYTFPENAKAEALLEAVEEAGNVQVVVWCAFRPEVAYLAALLEKTFERKAVVLTGQTPGAARAQAIETFRRGDAGFFVATAAAGGTGINGLQVASTEVFFSRNFKLGDYLQAQDRCHRPGQRNTVSVIKILAEGTVDLKVEESLEKKADMQEMLLRRPEEMI